MTSKPTGSSCLSLPSAGITGLTSHLAFKVGAGDPNLALHAFVASGLSTEP